LGKMRIGFAIFEEKNDFDGMLLLLILKEEG
jgi:hypothetical protein